MALSLPITAHAINAPQPLMAMQQAHNPIYPSGGSYLECLTYHKAMQFLQHDGQIPCVTELGRLFDAFLETSVGKGLTYLACKTLGICREEGKKRDVEEENEIPCNDNNLRLMTTNDNGTVIYINHIRVMLFLGRGDCSEFPEQMECVNAYLGEYFTNNWFPRIEYNTSNTTGHMWTYYTPSEYVSKDWEIVATGQYPLLLPFMAELQNGLDLVASCEALKLKRIKIILLSIGAPVGMSVIVLIAIVAHKRYQDQNQEHARLIEPS